MKYMNVGLTYKSCGEPTNVLEFFETPAPKLLDSEVLVQWHYVPILPADLATIRGVYRNVQTLPAVPGYDASGIVVEVGSDVKTLKPGMSVVPGHFIRPGWNNGTWQKFGVKTESELIPIPDDIPLEASCHLVNTLLTPWIMLKRLDLRQGDHVLMTAANSSVSRVAAQYCKALGIKPIGIARNQNTRDALLEAGFVEVLSGSPTEISTGVMKIAGMKGVPGVLDAVAGELATTCFKLLRDNGRMIIYGLQALQRDSQFDVRKMLFYNLTVEGFWVSDWWSKSPPHIRYGALNEIFGLLRDGRVICPIGGLYPLEQFASAIEHAERGGNSGKIVIKIPT